MDRVYYIYEWYDHCYSGFADYKGSLVHFDFKNLVSPLIAKNSPTYLFDLIPATAEFLNREISGELYFINSCEQDYPEILDYSTYCDARERRQLEDIIPDYPSITNEQWEAAEAQFQHYLFRNSYLEQNKNISFCKEAKICFNGKFQPLPIPYENVFIEWLD